MPPRDETTRSVGLVPPGPALKAVMLCLFATWLAFALSLNWGGASPDLFLMLAGNTDRILHHGEVWRLFTAPLLHAPDGLGHVFSALLGLFFLAPSLEQRWGRGRMLRFLAFSALIAYATQIALEVVLPTSVAARLVPLHWFGAFPVLEALAIAWALSFRGQTVRLWFLVPVSSSGLVWFVVAMSLLRVVVANPGPEGLLSPFGGMAAGWLLGSGTPSPLRRAFLRLRLAQLDREAARDTRGGGRPKAARFRVIEGGRGKSGSDDEPPDGRLLH